MSERTLGAHRTEHTAFIFFDQLLKMKGTDASWKDDQETPAQFADYSDDESEQKSRRKNKNATYKPGIATNSFLPTISRLRCLGKTFF